VIVSPHLLQRLRARDPDALAEVIEAFARRLYTTARALGFAPPDAEELAQDVFATFLATLDRFEGRSSLSTWLFGILYRKGQERRRQAARTVAHDPADAVFESWFDTRGRWVRPPAAPDEALSAQQLATALLGCLAQLPDLQRVTFELRQVEALTAAEAGEVLGTTVTHVGVLLHRARTRLRECLGRKGWAA
jgi:RNA polymerase sigma-70 factor, ECF subfamily